MPASLWYLAAGRRLPLLLGCVLLLLRLAAGKASQQAASGPPVLPRFHTLVQLADPGATPANARDNIQFCDFFDARSLQPNLADGFDDLSYMSSFFNVATSPLARAGQPSSRPREFIHGPAYSPHRCHSYPFAREPAAPFRMEPDRLSALNPVLTEAFSYGRSLLHRAHDHLVDGLYTFDPMRLVLGTTAAGSPFALQARVQYDGLEFMFLEENNFPSHHFMLEYEGFNFLQPTDLDGDGLVDAVTVAWLADIIAVDTGHPAPHAHGASNGSPASDSESMVAATPTSPPARTGEHGLFWLHRFGEAALAPGNPADVTLLMTLPDDIEVGQILIGDFDGDGLASDVAVLSGRDSTGPARIILLLTSDLSAPVTILLADMSFDDPALVSLSSLDHTPKAAAARLTATTGTGTATTPADDLVVAFGSRVWLIPGPIRPTGSPVTHDILALNSVPLLPDHPSTSGVWYSLAFGDFDADGHLDLALAHSDTVNDILLLSQVHATPRCLCGPGGICQRDPTSFYSLPSCACEDPHADLGFKLAPCEFCQVGYFRQTESSPCQQCSASCLTCAGPGMSDCLSCQPGFVFESSPLPTGLCVPDTTGNQVVVTFPDPERPYYQATSEIDLTIGFHVVPFNLHSTLQKTQTLVELRLQELFTMPTSKPTLVQGINHGNGHVIFHEDRLGGHLLHSRLSLAINRVTVSGPAGSIDMFLLGDRGDVCIAEPGKPCARFQTQWVSWLHNAHLGRVAPRPTPGDPPFVGILSNGHLGTRQVVDSHIHSAIWLQVDNNLDLDSVVVLHSPPSGPSKECHLGWQPRLAIDIFSYTYPMTAENLLPHTLPCGQLLGLPAVDPATRPPLLLVVTEPAAGEAFVYLLRNRGRGSDFRPHFDAPVPLLTGANLGHKTGHSPSRVLATLDPTDLTATEAALFLWDGTWVFRVVLRQHVPPGAGHSDSVTVLVEPLVPRTSFSWLSSASNLVLMPLDADGDGVAELVIFIPTGLMTLFRRSSEQNGCGCGRLGVCTIPSSWSASRCDGPAADSSCVYEPTALRTSDLCACAPGFQSPAGGSSGLCTMCDSSASGGFPPEFGVDCDACSVEGCYLCDASGECLRCRPGLVRTPTGGCAPTCPDPDAPVADAVCQARDPSDMWISSAEIPAHPSWAGARLVDVSTLRFVHQSNTPPGTRAAATTFPTLHVLPPNAVDSDTVWLLPAARLLADGRPADFGQLHLPAAAAWLANTCHLEGVVLPAADHKGPAAEDVDDGADAGPAMGMASPGPLARLSGRPPGVPRASGGDFTVAAVSQPRQLVDHSGVDMVPWSVLNRGEFPVPRPWFARLAEPFPGFGEEPGPTPTPPVYSQMFHFQRQLNSFYMVAEMEPVLFAPAPRVDPSDFRTCTLANTMEEAATRLTVYQSPELQDLRGQPYCSYSRIWVSLPAWELSMVPGQQSWSMSLSTIVLLHRPSNGERPSLVVLTREEAYRADQTGCHYRSLRVPLVAGAPALPIIPPSPSLASIVSLPIFLHVASVQEVHPAAGIAGPGIIAVGEHPYIANRLVVALSPSEPSPVNLQFALMRLLEDMPYLVFVRTDNLADSIMAMSTECLVENHKNWQMPSAPGPVLPEWAWPTTRPLYGCAPVLLETRPLDGHGPHGRPTVHSRDMDGDGLDDLVLHWPTTNRLVVYYTQVTAPLSFRQTVILPGNPQDSLGTQAVEDPALLTPQLFLADVDGDRFVDILLFDQAAPAGVRSSTPSGPVLRLFGRSDQTSNWCPAEVDYDPVTDECVCRGRLRHLTPLSDACECITHAVPVAPGAPDCVCPVGMAEGVGACVCQPGLLPVASESTGAPVSPPRCETCHASCASCSATRSGLCASCPPGHLLQAGVCVTACGPGLAISADGRQCVACAASCSACLGPASDQCSACAGNRYLPGGLPGTCRSCDAACSGCTGPTASQCTACAAGWLRAPSGECVRTCPEGTGISAPGSSQCKACADAGCLSCVTAQPGAICRTCRPGLQIDATGKQCLQCHGTCATCDGNGLANCLTCAPGLLLHGASCVNPCPDGTFADGEICSRCSGRCDTCVGPLSTDCTSCRPGWSLQGGNSCLPDSCPTCNDCLDPGCEVCSPADSGVCLICMGSKLLLPDGTCVDACPSGMYMAPSGDACLPCHGTCAECSSHRSNSCTACPGAHVLDRGYCREACPRLGFFEEAKTCRACHSSCLSCTGPGAGQCELCPRTHLFRDSHCLDGCPPGSTPLAGECAECAATCLDCAGPEASQCTACGPAMPSLWNGSCLETCPAGTFPGSDPSTSDTCLLCSSLCLECAGLASNQCAECAGDLLLHPVYGCASACGTGFLEAQGQCVTCHSSCRQCQDSPGFCTQCPAGKLLGTTPGTCVDRCGDREFADLTTPSMARCAACHNSCASCEGGAKPEDCTACSPGLFLLAGVGCVGACPSGYFVEEGPLAGSQACAPCVAECAECTGADAGHCTRCMDDRLLMVGSGYCRPVGEDTCPAGWHADLPGRRCLRCPDGCLACPASVEDCEQCSADMRSIRLLDREATDAAPVGSGPRTCVAMCPGGWFAPEGQADVCSACDMACGTCSGPGPDGCLEPNCDQPGKCPGNSSRSLILAIVLPLVFLLLLLVLAVILVCLLARRRRREAAKQGQAIPMQHIGDPEDMTVMNTMIELSLPGHLLLSPGVDYRIEPGCKELGKGAQAVVLPCTLLRTDLCTAAGGDAGAVKMVPADSSLRTQFEPLLDQEIAILSILLADGGSPFVCQLVGYSAAPSKALVMPHYPGLLSDLLWPSRLSPAQTLQMAADIAAGMAFIHSRGVVHKDLKPENIFLRPDPADPGRLQPVIGDFGVALVLNRFSVIPTLGNVAAGSLPYASPETLSRLYGMTFPLAPSDSSVVSLLKVDIYSLGVLLFGLVAAARPWTGTGSDDVATAVLAGKRPDMNPSSGTPVPVLVSDTGSEPAWMAEYRQIYRGAWAADPLERPSVTVLAEALAGLLTTSQQAAP